MSESEEQLKSSNGLVAFFDILGYRQIIANNGIKEAASIVKKVLKKVTEFREAADMGGKLTKYIISINYVSFSDSILVYTELSEDAKHRKEQASIFAFVCASLCQELFEEGLPARGAIAKGEFFIEQTSFAGKAIIEAYEFSNALELSGCVIVPTAEDEFVGISDLLFLYPVPLKGNQKQNLLILNLCMFLFIKDSDDPRQLTIEKFSRHNKNIGPEVVGKVNNTVHFLEQARAAIRKT